jgi:hypothetical protein
MTDETTGVMLELVGHDIEKEVGNRVSVSGSNDSAARPVASASQLMRVTQVARLSDGGRQGKNAGSSCDSRSGSAAGKGTPSSVPAGVGASTAAGGLLGLSTTTVAIVGGVAAAATLGGLAAANKLPSQSNGETESR